MKAILNIGLVVLSCACLLLSCRKDVAGKNEFKNGLVDGSCKIKQLILKAPGQKDKSGVITYNSNGDPVRYTPAGYNNSLMYEFRYDKSGRLTDYIGYNQLLAPARCEFWAKYTYDKRNRIVRDSVYYNSNYGQALTSHAKQVGVNEYEYDSKDRITSIIYRQFLNGVPNGIVGYYRFDYNEAGNLVSPGARYDDKKSIYRTNRIWMFLGRNYSVNNLEPAVSYNPNGLPAAFAASTARRTSMRFLDFIDLSDCEILYECDK